MIKKLAIALSLGLLTIVFLLVPGMQTVLYFPTEVTLFQGDDQGLDFSLPWGLELRADDGILDIVNLPLEDGLLFDTRETGSYDLSLNLLGLVTVRQLRVTVIAPIELVPGGHSIGVRLSETGVMVSGLDVVYTEAGAKELARESGFREGDIIITVNNNKLKNLEHAAALLEELSQSGRRLSFIVLREAKEIKLEVTPQYCEQAKKNRLGLLLRDINAGVGTLTFYEPETGIYGALGHMITDGAGKRPVDLSAGQIVEAEILSIQPGARGNPGEKKGIFSAEARPWGSISSNTELGIFGTLNSRPTNDAQTLPLGLRHQVKAGPAEILTVIEGNKIESFSIEIERVMVQNQPSSKGMVIRVTEPRLLAVTGGIVQGMSGSPIIQNGRIVGAVTHVFINEPNKGYGCFAEWMVLESGIFEEMQSIMPPIDLEAYIFLIVAGKL